MIDLRRLHVLRAVAYFGTVTAAAEALHLTPSAASQQIRTLGRELGVTLLEPDGRRIRLSQAARDLLVHADAIEERWQHAQATLQTAARPVTGVLRLCGFPTAVSALLAPLAAQLRTRHPALTVRIVESEPAASFDLIFAGHADLAVIEAIPDGPALTDSRFDQQALLRDPFDLLVPAGHTLTERDAVTLADAAREPWVLGMPGTSSRQHVLAACSAAGFSPEIAHEAREWNVVATLVAYGLGIALLPRLVQLPTNLAIKHIELVGQPIPSRQFLTCIRRGSHKHPAIAKALSHLQSMATPPPA
ncbi:MAG: LysR family transcriptional regulator [Actinophytocola sp.]|nr:LysR family transcriptional regulator [Actinophytocola sp.]